MKITYFVTAFPIRSETFVLNQIVGMIKRGHDVNIIAERGDADVLLPKEFDQYNLISRTLYTHKNSENKVYRFFHLLFLFFGIKHWYRLSTFKLLLKVILKKNGIPSAGCQSLLSQMIIVSSLMKGTPDIIHCQFGTLAPKVVHFAKLGIVKAKLFVSFRGFDATRYVNENPGVYRDLFQFVTLCLPVSKTLQRTIESLGCEQNKIEVHHSGIDCRKWRHRVSFPLLGEEIRLITVARLVEKKGISYAIKAVAILIKSGWRISYRIIGSGELRVALNELIKELGVETEVQLLGAKPHDEVLVQLKESHILIAPSITPATGDQEGIPNSLKESMALGIPVLATLHGGIPELVEADVSGCLVPERNVKVLANTLEYLLKNQERWPQMGEAGRARIEAEFDIERLNDRLAFLYRETQVT